MKDLTLATIFKVHETITSSTKEVEKFVDNWLKTNELPQEVMQYIAGKAVANTIERILKLEEND